MSPSFEPQLRLQTQIKNRKSYCAASRTVTATAEQCSMTSELYEIQQRPVKLSTVRQTQYRSPKLAPALIFLSLLLLCSDGITTCSARALGNAPDSIRSAQQYARAVGTAVLEVFQVYPPVLTVTPNNVLEITDGSSSGSVDVIPSQQRTCQEILVVHSFAYSYGMPYVGPYTPPSCSFNRVTWNLTVISAGRQFDRLGSVSFGNIELFRTSTAEPTTNGIEWTYLKDMTNFLSLFKQEQTIIFDLGNLVSDIYTGDYNVTLTAAFFTADDSIDPADLILPVSKNQGAAGQPSYFTVPDEVATSQVTLPRNVKKAVFTVAATGQAAEEFWWSNVLQSEINTYPAIGSLYGYSPFREVQVFIDGMLAGVAWPYPVIFTGGVVPGLWRPIVGIDAFDLKEDEIDITPWLPLLCDGNSHNFTIQVSGLNDNGNGTATLSETTLSNWWVDGKVFVWLDTPGHITTGSGFTRNVPPPTLQVSSQISKDATGANDTLLYHVNAQRTLSIRSTVNTSQGKKVALWSQKLAYTNTGNYTDQANVETNTQSTKGRDVSSSGYIRTYSYPLYAFSTVGMVADNLTIAAVVNRGKDVVTLGQGVFPTGLESFSDAQDVHSSYGTFQGTALTTSQEGQATYLANETSQTSYSYGTTTQDMTLLGIASKGDREFFNRHVKAVNFTVVDDEETLLGKPVTHQHGSTGNGQDSPLSGVPGRGNFLVQQGNSS